MSRSAARIGAFIRREQRARTRARSGAPESVPPTLPQPLTVPDRDALAAEARAAGQGHRAALIAAGIIIPAEADRE